MRVKKLLGSLGYEIEVIELDEDGMWRIFWCFWLFDFLLEMDTFHMGQYA